MKEIDRAIVIQNKETGELFVGKRGKKFFNTRGSATNSFNEAHSSRYRSGRGIFQSQDVWVHRVLIITQECLA